MKAMHRVQRFGADERAQAMTEFVIVIPLVLFLFFAMLQTMLLAQAHQLTNYAAFAAARSYATSFGKFFGETGDGNNAHDQAVAQAKSAALLVMAPISHAQAGESLSLWKPIRDSTQNMDPLVQQFYGLAEGYVNAMIYRMKGFNLTLSGSATDRKSVVKVEFDYLMPIAIPGFAEMWNYLRTRDKSATMLQTFDLGAAFINPAVMTESLQTVLAGLSTLEGLLGDGTFESLTDQISTILDDIYGSGAVGSLYNVTLKAKSVCGFEPWNGQVRTDDIEARCEGEFDEALQPCIDATRANDDLINKQVRECNEADEATRKWEEAKAAHQQAKNTYDNCGNPGGIFVILPDAYGVPTSVKKSCQAQWAAYQNARKAEDLAYAKMEKESGECEDAGRAVENAQQDVMNKCQPP